MNGRRSGCDGEGSSGCHRRFGTRTVLRKRLARHEGGGQEHDGYFSKQRLPKTTSKSSKRLYHDIANPSRYFTRKLQQFFWSL